MAFQFFRLPAPPMEMVLQQVFIEHNGVFDIERFAEASKKSRQIVQSVRLPLTGFDISINDTEVEFCYKIKDKYWASNQFKYQVLRTFVAVLLRDPDQDYELPYSNKRAVFPSHTEMTEAMEKVLSLFNLPVDQVFIHNGRISSEHLPHLFPTKICKKLIIRAEYFPETTDIQLCLDTCKATDLLSFSGTYRKDMTFDPSTIETDAIEFRGNFRWITREMMKLLNCKSCIVRSSQNIVNGEAALTLDDLEAVVEHWMESGNKKLEYLKVQFRQIPVRGLMLDKFNPKSFDPSRRAEVFVQNGIGHLFSNGVDIERPSDGLLATVFLIEDHFTFAVWHDRFPVMNGVVMEQPEQRRRPQRPGSDSP